MVTDNLETDSNNQRDRSFPIDQVEAFLVKNVEINLQQNSHDKLIQIKQKSKDKITTRQMKEFIVEYWSEDAIKYEND